MLKAHALDLQKFNEQQLDGLRELMAKHRDDAVRRYQAEMPSSETFNWLKSRKLTLDGFEEGGGHGGRGSGDWTDIARRAREHAGLPPDPDGRLGPAHGRRFLLYPRVRSRRRRRLVFASSRLASPCGLRAWRRHRASERSRRGRPLLS